MKKWLRPLAIEREYIKFVQLTSTEVNDAIEKYVVPVIPDLRQDAIDDIPESSGWYESLRQAFLRAASAVGKISLTRRVRNFGARISAFNKQQFHEIVREQWKVDIYQTEPWLNDMLAAWEAENIKLIKSIPQQALESLHGKIVQAVQRGATTKDTTKLIRDSYGVNKRRARLIARDQTGKLNGQLTQERQESIKVKKYKWRGSLDERERDSHVEREGKTFSWDKPPDDGHPGQPIQCRCTAEPILPLLEDLKGLDFPNLIPARGISKTKLARKSK